MLGRFLSPMYICYTSDMGELVIESMAGARRRLAEDAEDAWLNRLADEAEIERIIALGARRVKVRRGTSSAWCVRSGPSSAESLLS
jgi:hypothetical protein